MQSQTEVMLGIDSGLCLANESMGRGFGCWYGILLWI